MQDGACIFSSSCSSTGKHHSFLFSLINRDIFMCHACPWIIFPRCSSSLANANTFRSVNVLGAAYSICGATPGHCRHCPVMGPCPALATSHGSAWCPVPPFTSWALTPKAHLRNVPLEQRTKQNRAVSFFLPPRAWSHRVNVIGEDAFVAEMHPWASPEPHKPFSLPYACASP